MQNLIYLIIMALAGGAGWYAGSWSGRDAKSAVAAAQVAGKEIEGSREKIQTDLDSKIKTLTLAHDAELVQLQSKFDGESAGWKTTLAARDDRIKTLNGSAKTFRQQADDLSGQLAAAKSPEESKALKARIAELETKANKAEVESAGVVCSKQTVPDDMLAALRGVAP